MVDLQPRITIFFVVVNAQVLEKESRKRTKRKGKNKKNLHAKKNLQEAAIRRVPIVIQVNVVMCYCKYTFLDTQTTTFTCSETEDNLV